MSMSEEKAIRVCEKIIQQNNEMVKQTRKNNDINAIQLTANCDTESLAIETLIETLKKKDKIIELMAIFIANLDIDEDICKYQIENFCKEETGEVSLDVCMKCIKQYFENKVDRNEEE